jgi:hypothetical protein
MGKVRAGYNNLRNLGTYLLHILLQFLMYPILQ